MPTTMKYSRQREEIKNYLIGRKDHPTAEQIYADLRREDPKLSLGTVYRNLGLLSDLGEIRKIATQIGPDHFDADTSLHYHFICRQCHQLRDIPMHTDDALARGVTESVEGQVDMIELVAYGRCSSCAAEAV